jgi:ferritin-like metal-binding protein YciE
MATTRKTKKSNPKALQDLFLDGLKDIYYAEKKILKSLPKMAKGAESEEAAAAFEKHRVDTEGQVERLEQIFETMGVAARGKTCPAIDGILEEGSEILEEYAGSPALDAGLVAAAQAVEHYEIARYGTLITWAGLLGMTEAADLLSATLAEEEATDEALTALGEAGINDRAIQETAEAA